MITERTIINALVIAGTFLLAPYVISEALTMADYYPLLALVGLVFTGISFFFIKERLVVAPFLGQYFAGQLNFLPLPLNATHIMSIFVILYYFTGFVIIRQKPIKLGKAMFFWPIIVIFGIVLYHNHSLNLGSLGGTSEGAKPAILMYLVGIAYFCAINLPTPSAKLLSRIPLYAVIVTAVSEVPYLLTTVVPGLAPLLYSVTDNVNVESYSDSVNGVTSGVFAKLSAFGPLGSSVQLYLLCKYPIGTWLRPDRWWMILVSFVCAAMCASSGFRNVIFAYLCTLLIATWCYYSWRAIFLPVAGAVALMAFLTASTDNLINIPLRSLPFITQRTLSFLPGDWDPEAIESGKGSNHFRENIENVYIKEYMARSPLFGTGFTIDKAEFDRYNDPRTAGKDPDYAQAKVFIEGKMYHTGWISLYDSIGLVGSVAFFALAFNLIRVSGRFVFNSKIDRKSSLFPLYVWMFTNVLTGLISYFTVFGAISPQIIGMLVIGIILSHLSDLANKSDVPALAMEMQGSVEMPRISGAYYGRR